MGWRRHQESSDGGDGESAKAAPEGVGDEGTEQRRQAGGAAENVAQVGGGHLLHMVDLYQVHHEVGRQPVRGHPLERLVPCVLLKH